MEIAYPLHLFSPELRKSVEDNNPGYTADFTGSSPIGILKCKLCGGKNPLFLLEHYAKEGITYSYQCGCGARSPWNEDKLKAAESWSVLNLATN